MDTKSKVASQIDDVTDAPLISSFDVDSHRDECESSSEWKIRREFLRSNCDSLSFDRLICLSRCFVNVAIYGCSYPQQVMREINERSNGILEEAKKEQRLQAKKNHSLSFMKASDNAVSDDCHAGSLTQAGPHLDNSQLLEKCLNGESLSDKNENIESEKSIIEITADINEDNSSCDNMSNFLAHVDHNCSTILNSGQILSMTVPPARPLHSKNEYFTAWKSETNTELVEFRKKAYEVVALETDRPNAIDILQSASNVKVEFNSHPQVVAHLENNGIFTCQVIMNGINVASGQGFNLKDAKLHAYESALQKIFMPHLRVVNLDPKSRELQASNTPFTSNPPGPSKLLALRKTAQNPPSVKKSKKLKKMSLNSKDSKALCLKPSQKKFHPIEDFVIFEHLVPLPGCRLTQTLRRSADLNQMLMKYDYAICGKQWQCILTIENQVVADVKGASKIEAKNMVAAQAMINLKRLCWLIKIKKDIDLTISKEEILNDLRKEIELTASRDEKVKELNDLTFAIFNDNDNVGNKMLRKMGWAGGGLGKDGSGISEPIKLKKAIDRQGLGHRQVVGFNKLFRKRIQQVIKIFAASVDQDDLRFSNEFNKIERKIIHEECRKLKLKNLSRSFGKNRYLCVQKKRTAQQIFNHVMSCGGETAKYKLVPPGKRETVETSTM